MILKPDYNLESIFDIDFKDLKSKGIVLIIPAAEMFVTSIKRSF